MEYRSEDGIAAADWTAPLVSVHKFCVQHFYSDTAQHHTYSELSESFAVNVSSLF